MLGLLRSPTLESVLWLAGTLIAHNDALFGCVKEHGAPEMAVEDSH